MKIIDLIVNNIDTILSDPLLLTAAVLLIVGPILFLISLWNLIRTPARPKKKDPLFDLSESSKEPFFKEELKQAHEKPVLSAAAPAPVAPIEETPEPAFIEPVNPAPIENETPAVMPLPPKISVQDSEKTIVMPPGMAEIQGQLEIAFSQIKHLSKKVNELENAISAGEQQPPQPIQLNELKEPPMNPADFTQKLLKLAEHVIILEKNMARMMSSTKQTNDKPNHSPSSSGTPSPKPPVMPL